MSTLLCVVGCGTAPAPATRATVPEAQPVRITAVEPEALPTRLDPIVDITPVSTPTEPDLATIEIPAPPPEGTIIAPERVELEEEESPPPVVRRAPARSRRRRLRPTTMHDPVFSGSTVFAPSSDEHDAPLPVP